MKKRTVLTVAMAVLTFTALGVAGMHQTKPELEIQSHRAQIDKIMSKTAVIADVQVVEEKL